MIKLYDLPYMQVGCGAGPKPVFRYALNEQGESVPYSWMAKQTFEDGKGLPVYESNEGYVRGEEYRYDWDKKPQLGFIPANVIDGGMEIYQYPGMLWPEGHVVYAACTREHLAPDPKCGCGHILSLDWKTLVQASRDPVIAFQILGRTLVDEEAKQIRCQAISTYGILVPNNVDWGDAYNLANEYRLIRYDERDGRSRGFDNLDSTFRLGWKEAKAFQRALVTV